MKRCPTCQRSYTDDSLTFCLEDGAPLKHEPAPGSSSEPPATMILKEPPPTSSNRNAAPTEMYNATPTQGASAPGYTPPPPRPSWTPQPPAPQAQPFGQSSWAATSAGAAAAPPNKFLLAIFGGILMAVPSLIPLIQFGCCLWAAGGGLLAAGLYIRKSPAKVEMGEGAILGAIAGGIGGLINLGIGLPVTYNLYGPEGPLHTKDGDLGGTMVVVGIFGSLMLVAFSIAGGLLAVPLFEKRRNAAAAAPPPPPPPTYGSGTGGYR